MEKKVDYTKAEKLQEKTYFDCKVDMIPASLKETYSEIGKTKTLVNRELSIDGHLFLGIEYATDGNVASVYTKDNNGRRVNFENSAEKTASGASKDLISERLDEVTKTLARENANQQTTTPQTPEKKRTTPRQLDPNLHNFKQNERA